MITYQIAIPSDLENIAQLHAKSWQENNRGILADDYLDNKVQGERLEVWTKRFTYPSDNQHIITAKEKGALLGFTCLFGGKDSKYGTYLDNLHIGKKWHGKGIGQQLMVLAGQWSHAHYPNQGMYLFVFAVNIPAIGFYNRIGGKPIETVPFDLGDGTGRMGDTIKYFWEKPNLIRDFSNNRH